MSYEKQYLLVEAARFYSQYNRSPKAAEWDKINDYPTVWYVRKEFGSWTKFLTEANLPLNLQTKSKYINCEICKRPFETSRINRKICDSKKCQYVRDSLYHVNVLKEKYKCSAFHFIPEDKLIDYFSCVYQAKKEYVNMVNVI